MLPAFTVAVNVTTLPGPTSVTAPPSDVIARVVVVALAAQACCAPPQKAIHKTTEINNWQRILSFMDKLHSCLKWANPPWRWWAKAKSLQVSG
jgi:hypothetical protein